MTTVLAILCLIVIVGGGVYVFTTKGAPRVLNEKRFLGVTVFTIVAILVFSNVIQGAIAGGTTTLTGVKGTLSKSYTDAVPTFEAVSASADGLDAARHIAEHAQRYRNEASVLTAERDYLVNQMGFEVASEFEMPGDFADRVAAESSRDVEVADYSDYVERLYRSYFVKKYAASPEYVFLGYSIGTMSVKAVELDMDFSAYVDKDEPSTLLQAHARANQRLLCYNLVVDLVESCREAQARSLANIVFEKPSGSLMERCRIGESEFFAPIVLSFDAQLDELGLFRLLAALARPQKIGDRQPLAIERMTVTSPSALAEDVGQNVVNASFTVVAYRIDPDKPFFEADEEADDPGRGQDRRGARPRYW